MAYKFVKRKGQGGFGIVDIVEEKGKQYARKTFHISPFMAELEDIAKKRFIKEAKYQEQIDHPNIVPVLEVEHTEPPAFIMPLAEASMLEDIQSNELHSGNFRNCLSDIMAGLEELHALGIYHRDLKPANVLRFKKTGYAIGDFGLMSLNQTGVTTITQTGMAKTTDLYTAPEITQDLKYASVQSDIFSLGCILHDFVGQTNRIALHEISETNEYSDILAGATRMNPRRRFSSVATFREALASITNIPATPKTRAAEIVLESLAKETSEFDEKDISKLSNFLSSSVNATEKSSVLEQIGLKHIGIILQDEANSSFIAKVYCEHVRTASFNFEMCDTIANRVSAFMKNNSVDVLAEGAFALLYMGTSHNRWYVERKAIKYFAGEIEPRLLQRMIMEIRIDDKKFCRALDHLSHSISYSKSDLHPDILKAVKQICKK
ncbi:MAG: protein kinase [Cyclobacteriaceae bacterium]|nr:protein kinase [Cyclobacteriaceae bacterium]